MIYLSVKVKINKWKLAIFSLHEYGLTIAQKPNSDIWNMVTENRTIVDQFFLCSLSVLICEFNNYAVKKRLTCGSVKM